jgi:hypothetical protein
MERKSQCAGKAQIALFVKQRPTFTVVPPLSQQIPVYFLNVFNCKITVNYYSYVVNEYI